MTVEMVSKPDYIDLNNNGIDREDVYEPRWKNRKGTAVSEYTVIQLRKKA